MNDAEAVKFKYEIDYTKALAGCLQIVSAEQKMVDTTRQLDTEAGRTQKTMEGFGKVAGDIGKIGLGIIGASSAMEILNKAIGVGIKEFDELDRKLREAHRAGVDFAGSFSQIISESFGTEKIDEIFERLKVKIREGKIPELGYESATKLIKAYKGARPEADIEETIKAVEMTAPMVQYGKAGQESLTKLAGELKQIFPEKEMGDIYDIAVTMRQRAGKYRDELSEAMRGVRQLQEWGVGGEQGLGLLLGMLGAEQQPRAMTGLVNILADEDFYKVQGYDKRYGMKKVGHRFEKLTEEEQLKILLQQKKEETPEETGKRRFEWITGHPEEAQKLYREKLGKILPGLEGGRQGTEAIQTAQAADAYMKEYIRGLESKLVQEKREDVILREKTEGLKIDVPEKFKTRGEKREKLDEYLKSVPGMGAIDRELIQKIPRWTSFFGLGDEDKMTLWMLRKARDEAATPTHKYYTGLYSGQLRTEEYTNPNYSPETVKQLDELINMLGKGTSDNTETTRANTESNKKLIEAIDNLTTVINSGRMVNREVRTGVMD